MANITISNLHSVSSDLVFNSESFLNELTEHEIEDILGGDKVKVSILWGFITYEYESEDCK